MKKWLLLIGSVVLITLSGCATDISPKTYSVGSVGQINRTIPATVISTRMVDVAGTAGTGGTAGTVAGAAAGSSIGGGTRSNIIGAIGGAVVGGLAGSSIEASATRQKGMEYVVETENGNLITLVQGPEPAFTVGQKVLVLYGSPSRLIADPRTNR